MIRGGDSVNHGKHQSYAHAVAKVAALIDATVNALGSYEVTPKKKGGEWAVISVDPK